MHECNLDGKVMYSVCVGSVNVNIANVFTAERATFNDYAEYIVLMSTKGIRKSIKFQSAAEAYRQFDMLTKEMYRLSWRPR